MVIVTLLSMIQKHRRSILATDALVIDKINSYYGDSHVLHDVSLTLKSASLLALLGRNGAGKSTTMMTIAGLVTAKSGDIRLFGKELARQKPETIARSGIRLVPQGRRIFPSLSVEENLKVAAQNRDIRNPWNIPRVYNLFPQLRDRFKQRAGTLSGGEQQMLAIGRALMGNPDVLLLDEPSEGLAPLIVAEVARGIKEIKNEGLSILLVEQNFQLAMSIADDVAVLNTGRVAYQGTIAEVQANPELATKHLGVF
jgi:branched-chain amino acid transport system ATP-binding protein